jgi:long-chain fatty acid transport protein
MGGAFTAMADDYSATYYNPAGLAQAKETSLSFGIIQPIHTMEITFLDTGEDIEFTDNRGVQYNNPTEGNDGDNFNTRYPMLGLSLNINTLLKGKIDIPINIQAGIFAGLPGNFNHMFTLNTTPPDVPTAIAFGDQIEHFSAALGLGFEVKENLIYFGLGTLIGAEMAGPYPLTVYDAIPQAQVSVLLTQADAPTYKVLAYTAGVLITPFNQKLKIGASYKEQIDTVKVDFTPVIPFTSEGFPMQNMRVAVDFIVGFTPEQFNFGVAYVFDTFTLSVDLKMKKWSDYPYSNMFYILYHVDKLEMTWANKGYEDPGSPDFDDITDIGVGVEYRRSDKLVFTAGYEYRPTPVPEQSFMISNYIDMDKDVFSLGVNYKVNSWLKIGGLVQYMMLTDFKVYKTGSEQGFAWGWDSDFPQKSYKVDGDAYVFGLSVEFSL